MPTPGVIAELHTDPLRDAPLRGKDANTLLLVVDKSAPQPGIASERPEYTPLVVYVHYEVAEGAGLLGG